MKTIIITGCNKGIGFGILENLSQKNYNIIMACRNTKLAEEAKSQIQNPKSQIQVFQLDVSSNDSINQFVEEFKQKIGTYDILLNNAGMAYKGDAFNADVVDETFRTNFFGTRTLTQKMLSMINKNGKIINVSSMAGTFKSINEDLQKRFLNGECLDQLYSEYIESVKNDTVEQNGWKKWGYGLSKLFLTVFTSRLTQLQIIKDMNIQVYSLCPGWVKTDMAGPKAPLTIQQGAETPVYLVELPFEVNEQFQGKVFSKKQPYDIEKFNIMI